MAINYKAGKPEARQFFVEPGEYTIRVIDAKEDTSKTGNDMIKLTLEVVMKDGSKGPRLFDYLVFTEKARFKADQFLQATGEHPGDGKDYTWDEQKLIGLECQARLTVEEYDNKKSNKVEAYLFDEY